MKKNITLYSIIILTTILLLTIGYSAFIDSLSVSDVVVKVRPEKNTRISAITTTSSNITNLDYSMYEITGEANIPNNSSVTFNTTITTYENVPAALSDIKVYNGNNEITNVTITPDLTNTFIRICTNDSDNLENCKLNSSKDIPITITNNTGSAIVTNNFKVVLTFTPFYKVTYSDSVNGEIIGYVLNGDTYTYTFQSNPPTTLTVDDGTCGTPTITNNILTVPNVTSNIVLTGTTSGLIGDGSWDNPYELSDSTYHYNDLDAGSYKFTELAGEPEITVDANHKVTKYELTNCGTGLDISGKPVESGILAFDNQKITIDLEFTTNFSNSSNYYKCLVTALSSTNNSTYSGFRITNKKNGMMYVHTMNNQSIASNGTGGYQIIDYTISNTYSKIDTKYTAQIIYDPSDENLTITINPGSINESGSITSITNAMKDATITIGGNGINNNNDMGQLVINSLTVTKG